MSDTIDELGKYSRLGWKYSRLKAIKDALEFYGMLDCKAKVPSVASPAMVALSYVEELMETEGKAIEDVSNG